MSSIKSAVWYKIVIGMVSLLLLWKFISAWPWLLLLGITVLVYWYFKKKAHRDSPSDYAKYYLLFIALIVSFSVGEICLRAMGKNASYNERGKNILSKVFLASCDAPFNYKGQLLKYRASEKDRGIHCSEFNYCKPTNSQGYVDKEWNSHRSKKHRYVFFGDSFTKGVGAPMDSSYVTGFERLAGDSIEMYNAGVDGSDPCSEYMLLKQEIMTNYKPDRIYVAVNESDIFNVIEWGGLERFTADGEVRMKNKRWWQGIYAQSFLVRLHVHQNLGLNRQYHTPEEAKMEHETAIEKIKACIDSFQTLAAANDIQCIFVFHPMRYEVVANLLTTASILEYAKSRDYTTINILDAFIKTGANAGNIDNYFWKIDGHNNSAGYRVIAEGLLETL